MKTKPIAPVAPKNLRWVCPPSALPFKTSTKELKPLRKIVGQSRAIEALELGICDYISDLKK